MAPPRQSWSDFATHLMRAGIQGATLGAGDEIAAGLAAPIRAALTEDTLSQAYARQLAAERGQLQGFRQEYPKTAFATELGGALVPVVVTGGAAATPTVGRAIAAGAGYGAAQGFLEGEGGLANRVDRGLDTAIGGAVLAGPLHGASKLVSADKVASAAEGVRRRSLGFTLQNYLKSLGGIGDKVSRKDGSSMLKQTIDRLRKDGGIDETMITNPGDFLIKTENDIHNLGEGLNILLEQAEETGIPRKIHKKDFKKAEDFLRNKYMGDEQGEVLRYLDKQIKGALKTENLDNLVETHIAKRKAQDRVKDYNRDTPAWKAVADQQFASAMRQHIENQVERAVKRGGLPSAMSKQVRKINQQIGDRETIIPTIKRNLAFEESGAVTDRLMRLMRTSGGAGSFIVSGLTTGNPLLVAGGTVLGTLLTNPKAQYKTANLVDDLTQRYLANLDKGRVMALTAGRAANQYSDVGLTDDEYTNLVVTPSEP